MIETDVRTRPEATTSSGPVRGLWGGETAVFLGIPFAQAPVGDLRFAAPTPPHPWTTVRDADQYGPTTDRVQIENHLMPETVVPGNATLNVNVFTPSLGATGDDLRPVMVWFHGGGYIGGSPKNDWYEGQSFVRDGIVVVTVDYRLGFDGFGMIPGAPDNRGLRDWLAALQWARQNLAAFGGDPDRITIAGQSAGGGAVLTLLGLPEAQGLFRAAISLSGALGDQHQDRARSITRRMARMLRVRGDRAGFASVSESRLLSAQTRVLAVRGFGSIRRMFDGVLPIGPVIGGDLFPRSTLESIASGVGADKPLLLVTCDAEMILDGQREVTPAVDRVPHRLALRVAGRKPSSVPRFRAMHRDESTRRMLAFLAGDALFRVLAVKVARARQGASTWVARVAWKSPTYGDAIHCVDLPFFFDVLGEQSVRRLVGDAAPQPIADALHGAAVRLIEGGEPTWRLWTRDTEATEVLDTTIRSEDEGMRSVEDLVR